MNLMKINNSFIANSYSRVLFCVLLIPTSIFANEPGDKILNTNFCDAPAGTLQQLENFEAIDTSLDDSDLGAIKERGTLRVLLHRKTNECIISQTEQQLIEEFANLNDLDLKWIYVDNDWELLPDLIKGNADIIVAQDQGLSASIQDQIKFTHDWTHASIKIVERADNSRISRIEDLAGRQVAAYKSSPVWNKLLELAETQVGMVLQEIPPTVTVEEIMQRVKTAQYDLAVADSLFLDKYLPSHTELQANFNLTDERRMAWAVRSVAEELHKTLNQYLNQQHLTHNIASVYFEDLSSIKDRGVLRVITNSNPSHYYLHKGKLFGFEYELLKQFATQFRLRVDVVLASSQEEMFELLREGKGDVIAASLPSGLLNENGLVQYSAPYNYASPVIVGRNSDEQIIDLRDLVGRRITLAQDSPYWDYMLQLKQQGLEFELVKADDGINMEGTLLMVALGMYDLTVVGNHQITVNKSKMTGLKAQFVLSEPQAHRWAVRADDQQLHDSLNSFVEKEFRSATYNVTHAKYFEQPQIKKTGKNRFTQFTSISPYDDMTQQYSEKYGFDWRLITALMFQESQFNPDAYSYAGAEGLMQLIPATAELMGVSDTSNPETSINAGVRYLHYLRAKFEDSILLEDRIWFTLASYNAGYGRVKRARELAEKMGLDKDRWFDNVEIAMMGLGKSYIKEGKQVRYCQCGQAVVYVREIRTRYFNYIRLLETQKVAMNTTVNYINRSEVLN
jgi:peptidoglycan lytic transglycosylase F